MIWFDGRALLVLARPLRRFDRVELNKGSVCLRTGTLMRFRAMEQKDLGLEETRNIELS